MSDSNEQAYSGHHHNFSLFILSQKLNSISTGIRDNANRVVLFRTHNKRSLKILQEEFFGHINDQKEEAALQKPLSANKYLDINININRTPASYTSTKHAYIDIYVYAKTQVSNSRYSKRAARESPVLRIRG